MNLGDCNMAAADACKLFLVIDDITFFMKVCELHMNEMSLSVT